MKIYLAGPDVFDPDALSIGERKKALCADFGFTGVFPLDNVIKDFRHDEETGLRIGRANEALMDSCDVLVANMAPWQGPGMDTGTAYEMGYMRAQKKWVLGYTSRLEPFSARVTRYFGGNVSKEESQLTGPDGFIIENFGDLSDNLMMVNAIVSSGFSVTSTLEACLQQLKARLGG